MPNRDHALDILIEDLSLQLLSAELAAEQAVRLEARIRDGLSLRSSERASARRSGARRRPEAGDLLEIQRAFAGMAARSGIRTQETRALADTLEWDLRFYLSRREAERGETRPAPRRRTTTARQTGRSR